MNDSVHKSGSAGLIYIIAYKHLPKQPTKYIISGLSCQKGPIFHA